MSVVDKILYGHQVDMGGIKVRQPIPTANVDQIDPFLLLHHHASINKPGLNPRDVGVGPHPHRGFSPVTFIFKGSVHHRDSRGNSSIVNEGGAQWMNAGMGIIHSERPSAEFAENGGPFEIIQLWINTPGEHKMDQPVYLAIPANEMPEIKVDSGDGFLHLVSGNLDGKSGPVQNRTPITSAMGYFKKGGLKQIYFATDHNTIIYLLEGKLRIKGFGLIEAHNMIVLDAVNGNVEIEALENSRFLFLSGKPMNEPVETYGPFVMSNQTEIMQAMRDYQMGKMGILIEEFD